MKTSIFISFNIFFLLFFQVNIFSQSTSVYGPDPRLYECYDSSYISQLQKTNPMLIVYYNYYLDHSYYTVKLEQPKPVTGDDIHTVTLNDDLSKKKTDYFNEAIFDAEKFNPLKYSFKLQDQNFTTYLWKEAGIAIVFLPLKKISENYQNYIKENNIE